MSFVNHLCCTCVVWARGPMFEDLVLVSTLNTGLICLLSFCSSNHNYIIYFQVEAVDTNGAGDTFATAYMLALSSRWPSPAAFANWAASRAVMMPQSCKPHCVKQGLRADSTFAKLSSFVFGQVDTYPAGSMLAIIGVLVRSLRPT